MVPKLFYQKKKPMAFTVRLSCKITLETSQHGSADSSYQFRASQRGSGLERPISTPQRSRVGSMSDTLASVLRSNCTTKNHRSLAGWLAGRLAGKLCEILRRLTESEETLRTHYRSVYLWDGRFWSPCGCWHSGVQYLILKTNHASNMFVNCLKFNLLNSYGVDSGVDPSGCRPGCNPPKVRALA